jgi:hypothetical protein
MLCFLLCAVTCSYGAGYHLCYSVSCDDLMRPQKLCGGRLLSRYQGQHYAICTPAHPPRIHPVGCETT